MLRIEIEEGDVLIRRVRNGWITKSVSEEDSTYLVTDAYTSSGKLDIEKALCILLYEHFDGYTQSKRQGGICITIQEKGHEDEGGEIEDEEI